MVHVKIENKLFDNKTGQKLSTPMIQKFHLKFWNKVMSDDNNGYDAAFKGKDIVILHHPERKSPGRVSDEELKKSAQVDLDEAIKATDSVAPKKRGRKPVTTTAKSEE